MAKRGSHHRSPADIAVGGYAWLSTKHLKLAPGLPCKLATKFFGAISGQ